MRAARFPAVRKTVRKPRLCPRLGRRCAGMRDRRHPGRMQRLHGLALSHGRGHAGRSRLRSGRSEGRQARGRHVPRRLVRRRDQRPRRDGRDRNGSARRMEGGAPSDRSAGVRRDRGDDAPRRRRPRTTGEGAGPDDRPVPDRLGVPDRVQDRQGLVVPGNRIPGLRQRGVRRRGDVHRGES